jgi:NADPH2:quinone reductase
MDGMKAAYIEKTGTPEVIQYGDLPVPEIKPHEVLVKVLAVSVNPIDTYIRNGANYWPLPQPFIIGCDLAGAIVAVGSDVKNWRVGNRVWGSNQGLLGRQGTFAEFAAVDPQWLYPTPANVSDEAAAACALVGITAHLGLFAHGHLKAGETIFVRGGTGGVGAMVLQMGRAIGAKVITTAGSAEKAERCRQLGADHVIEYRTCDWGQELMRLAPQGVDLFWETLREPDFDSAVAAMAPRGRMILMAGRDARPPFPVGPFYVKGCSLHGFAMFKATAAEQAIAATQINDWLSRGAIGACIDRVLPLADAAAAHALQEANTVRKEGNLAGKIVLKP